MSYLVLARKYRPLSFSEIVGQDHVVKTLQNALSQDRIHHAFLLCGARGTGKTTTARILAKALCCEHAPTANPCNTCTACIEITQGTSVDVQEIDAASQNKVEDIRELRESIRYAPLRGKKKIYILDEVHMLSNSAFNALLKTLEEPPPHAVFVFATTDPHKLPATILSRVQRYDFKLVPFNLLMEHLGAILQKETIPFDPKALLMIAREGGGSVRDALSLLDQVLALHHDSLTQQAVAETLGIADRAFLFELGNAIIQKQPEQTLLLVDQATQKGYELSHVAKAFLEHLRNIIVAQFVSQPAALLETTQDEIALLQQQAKEVGLAADFLFQRMLRIAEDVSKSPFPRYALEIGLVELCLRDEFIPLDELASRLEPFSGGGPAPAPSKLPVSKTTSALPEPAQIATDTPPPTPVIASEPKKAYSIATESPKVTSSETIPAWDGLVQRVVQKNPLLHLLALCRLLSGDRSHFTIGVDHPFLLEQLRDKKAAIEQALQTELGHSIRIEWTLDDSNGHARESLLESEERKTKEATKRKQQEALSHPTRDVIKQVFGESVVFQDPKLE